MGMTFYLTREAWWILCANQYFLPSAYYFYAWVALFLLAHATQQKCLRLPQNHPHRQRRLNYLLLLSRCPRSLLILDGTLYTIMQEIQRILWHNHLRPRIPMRLSAPVWVQAAWLSTLIPARVQLSPALIQHNQSQKIATLLALDRYVPCVSIYREIKFSGLCLLKSAILLTTKNRKISL